MRLNLHFQLPKAENGLVWRTFFSTSTSGKDKWMKLSEVCVTLAQSPLKLWHVFQVLQVSQGGPRKFMVFKHRQSFFRPVSLSNEVTSKHLLVFISQYIGSRQCLDLNYVILRTQHCVACFDRRGSTTTLLVVFIISHIEVATYFSDMAHQLPSGG